MRVVRGHGDRTDGHMPAGQEQDDSKCDRHHQPRPIGRVGDLRVAAGRACNLREASDESQVLEAVDDKRQKTQVSSSNFSAYRLSPALWLSQTSGRTLEESPQMTDESNLEQTAQSALLQEFDPTAARPSTAARGGPPPPTAEARVGLRLGRLTTDDWGWAVGGLATGGGADQSSDVPVNLNLWPSPRSAGRRLWPVGTAAQSPEPTQRHTLHGGQTMQH